MKKVKRTPKRKAAKSKTPKRKAPVKRASAKKERLHVTNFKVNDAQHATLKLMAKKLTKGVISEYIREATTNPKFTKFFTKRYLAST